MKVEFNFINLYYYLSQALIGYITSNIRAISVEYDKKSSLRMYVYLESASSDIDRENIFSALSEAESMFDERIDYDVDFIATHQILTAKEEKDFWLYMRYEPDEEQRQDIKSI